MLFGWKSFDKALAKLQDVNLTDDQRAEGLFKAINKVCRANLLGGVVLTFTGIFAGVGFKELKNRHRQRTNEELKATNKEET